MDELQREDDVVVPVPVSLTKSQNVNDVSPSSSTQMEADPIDLKDIDVTIGTNTGKHIKYDRMEARFYEVSNS